MVQKQLISSWVLIGYGNSFSTTFCVRFPKKKMFLMLYPISWPNFSFWLPLLLETELPRSKGNICIAIAFFPGCDVINFGINLMFLTLYDFSTWPKSQNKNLNIFRTKRDFKVKQKPFFIILKAFQLSRFVSDLRVHL